MSLMSLMSFMRMIVIIFWLVGWVGLVIHSMALLPTSYAELDLADFMAIYALTKVGIFL